MYLTAIALDPRRGDLWVASTRGNGAESASVVHKLQLISGRSLAEVRAPEKAGPVRLVAVTVTADGVVFALDELGSRLFVARPGTKTLEHVMRIDAEKPSSLAVAGPTAIYVASARGVLANGSCRAHEQARAVGGRPGRIPRARLACGLADRGGTPRRHDPRGRRRLDPSGTRAQAATCWPTPPAPPPARSRATVTTTCRRGTIRGLLR